MGKFLPFSPKTGRGRARFGVVPWVAGAFVLGFAASAALLGDKPDFSNVRVAGSPPRIVGSPRPSFGDRDCGDFASQRDAQDFFERAGRGDPHRLDADGDGRACDLNSVSAR